MLGVIQNTTIPSKHAICSSHTSLRRTIIYIRTKAAKDSKFVFSLLLTDYLKSILMEAIA